MLSLRLLSDLAFSLETVIFIVCSRRHDYFHLFLFTDILTLAGLCVHGWMVSSGSLDLWQSQLRRSPGHWSRIAGCQVPHPQPLLIGWFNILNLPLIGECCSLSYDGRLLIGRVSRGALLIGWFGILNLPLIGHCRSHSYDGRLLIGQVSRAVKYRILNFSWLASAAASAMTVAWSLVTCRGLSSTASSTSPDWPVPQPQLRRSASHRPCVAGCQVPHPQPLLIGQCRSLSYDGRLVIGHVSRAVKYRILNLSWLVNTINIRNLPLIGQCRSLIYYSRLLIGRVMISWLAGSTSTTTSDWAVPHSKYRLFYRTILLP